MVVTGSDAQPCYSVNSSCADCVAVGSGSGSGSGAPPRCGWQRGGSVQCVPSYGGAAVFPYSGATTEDCDGGSSSSGGAGGFVPPRAHSTGAYVVLCACALACAVAGVLWWRRRGLRHLAGAAAAPLPEGPAEEEDAVSTAASGRDYVGLNS